MTVNLVTPPQLDWTDPAYSQNITNAYSSYQNAVNPLIQQRGTEAARYGYKPTYDANGYVQAVTVDPNDPYSKANLLTQSYKEGQAANRNSFAGRGQLYAGSLNAAQGRSTRGYNIGSNNLQQAFIDFIAGNQAAIDTAGNNYNTAVGGEYGNALGRYVPPDSPVATEAAAPAAPTAGPTGYSGPTGIRVEQEGGNGVAYYYDQSGARHATQYTNGKYYYLTGSGKWAPIP